MALKTGVVKNAVEVDTESHVSITDTNVLCLLAASQNPWVSSVSSVVAWTVELLTHVWAARGLV